MAAPGDSDLAAEPAERFRHGFEGITPSCAEAVGLAYGGFLMIGWTAGAIAGYAFSGGWLVFLRVGWIVPLLALAY